VKTLFGTDGIRGEAGKFPLDSPTVTAIGFSLAEHLAEREANPQIIIGRDTRESGESIERALIEGANKAGVECLSAGVITTPGVAFLTRKHSASAGVVISASHNPFADNGIKIFDPSGRKLDDATERQIESDVAKGDLSVPEASDAAPAINKQDAIDLRKRYLDYLEHEIGDSLSLSDLKIVVDCANGAASEIAPKLLSDLAARIIAINNQPNGQNINLNCGSLHIEALQQRVLTERADVGVAFDGDADRALFVDADGNFVDGDATMWVLANYMKERGELNGENVVATVMTNLGLEVALRGRGIKLSRTDVGDKYVLDELLRSKAALGGEQSGHIIFPRVSLAGDGMITALKLLRVMKDEGKSLAELMSGFVRYPQCLINVKVREKVPFESVPAIAQRTQEVQRDLGDRGRLLLRYSGTEALARVMIEGEDEAQVRTSANTLADVIRGEIGA
jgi:phosphoglucosamine mutase